MGYVGQGFIITIIQGISPPLIPSSQPPPPTTFLHIPFGPTNLPNLFRERLLPLSESLNRTTRDLLRMLHMSMTKQQLMLTRKELRRRSIFS